MNGNHNIHNTFNLNGDGSHNEQTFTSPQSPFNLNGSTSSPIARHRRSVLGSQSDVNMVRTPVKTNIAKDDIGSPGLSMNRTSQVSVYGGTPLYLRRIRAARTDIGDLGRAHTMDNKELNRIVDNPNEEFIFTIRKSFTEFFDKFVLNNYPDIALLDDDYEILELAEKQSGNIQFGYYGWKMLNYIQNQMTEKFRIYGDKQDEDKPTYRGFEINLNHISVASQPLYNLIIESPADSVCEIDTILVQKYFEIVNYIEGETYSSSITKALSAPKVRFFNKPERDSPRTLEPNNIDTLVSVYGNVIRCSDLVPEISMAAFLCTGRKRVGIEAYVACDYEVYEQIIEGEVLEPTECPECNSKKSFELWHNMCHFASKQLIKISELVESIPPGESPQTISVYAYDDLIDAVQPGDQVEVVGIYKASAVRLDPRIRNLNAVFRTYIDALNLKKSNHSRIKHTEVETRGLGIIKRDPNGQFNEIDYASCNLSLSNEIITQIENLSRDPDVYEKLAMSISPTIYGRTDIKKGLLCQLFGGTKIKNDEFGNFRPDIHILLCGDPSTAKSQLLQYVHKLAPRGVFASGKGSSGVGLTAAVSKDPDTKDHILESGAVVLSDRGICCIDEFDKMDQSARSVLHEVMEQQSVSIAKAGIVASLNARTAILASANPIHSRYDRRRAVVENINLPPSLFSRFDLIYLVLDKPDEAEDRTLANMLCALFSGNSEIQSKFNIGERPIPPSLLAHYISYARATCNPKLSKEASASLRNEYLKMRHQDGDNTKVPTASPRQVDSLIRLSESLAKMRLSPIVTKEDALEAVRLMKVATYQSLIDPFTGKIDFDQVNIGQTERERSIIDHTKNIILQVLNDSPMTKEQVIQKVQELTMNFENNNPNRYPSRVEIRQIEEAIAQLEKDQNIVRNNSGQYKIFISFD